MRLELVKQLSSISGEEVLLVLDSFRVKRLSSNYFYDFCIRVLKKTSQIYCILTDMKKKSTATNVNSCQLTLKILAKVQF